MAGSVFLTPAELCERYDARRVAEVASDTGVPVTDPTLAITNPLADPNIVACVIAGSADFIAGVRQSDRYQYTWLDQIYFTTDAPHTPPLVYTYPQRQLIISITSAFAFTRLVARRGMAEDELKGLSPLWEDALATRQAFLSGELIIDDPNGLVAAAGVTVEVVRPSPQLCSWTTGNVLFGAGCGCGNWNGARNRYGW
jgi:hypothetical protein